ncbi:hypothetical protein LCGC14_2562370 [marine sediment metagenome]|uniref:YkgJ family cysteine cluster protein n=1 Tax=marine sediment metagenome TaxID=412755 RepID=A0A0F9B7N1_9ZZZZ
MNSVKISSRWARHLFACTQPYILSVCKGRCCQGTDRLLIALTPDEAEVQTLLGKVVTGGLLQPDERGLCPWKHHDGLCGLHGTRDKPLGCVASPFTLNSNDTLIIRNRYSRMRCHGTGEPAYKVFRASLDAVFGMPEADRIVGLLDAGCGDITATMLSATYNYLRLLDGLKTR